MPLGVFALVKNNQNAASSNIFFQLALDKSGDISGVVYNSKTDKSYGVEGVANQKRQSATWKMSNSENSPFIETGLYNLTADQAPARIYYANGITEDVLLVRINQF